MVRKVAKTEDIDSVDSTLPPTNSLTLRLEISNQPGMIGKVLSAIGDQGATVGAIDLVEMSGAKLVRDITFSVWDEKVGSDILKALKKLQGVKVIRYSDPILSSHLGGKIEMQSKIPLKTRRDLSIAYTPGVGRVCMHIYNKPETLWELTGKRNTVAVVTDGTAVLGLGDIGLAPQCRLWKGKPYFLRNLEM